MIENAERNDLAESKYRHGKNYDGYLLKSAVDLAICVVPGRYKRRALLHKRATLTNNPRNA